MDNHFDKKQLDKARQLAASPQGQQLLSALAAANPALMSEASAALRNNDYRLLATTLAPLLESDTVRQLLQQMGD